MARSFFLKNLVASAPVLAIAACAGPGGDQVAEYNRARAEYNAARYDAALSIVRQVDADPFTAAPDSLRRYANTSRQPLPAEGTRQIEMWKSGGSSSSMGGTLKLVTGSRDGWLGTESMTQAAGGSSASSSHSKFWQLDGGLLSVDALPTAQYPTSHDIVAFRAEGTMFPLGPGKRWSYTYRQRDVIADADASNNITKIAMVDVAKECTSERERSSVPALDPVWRIRCQVRSAPMNGDLGNSLGGQVASATSQLYSPVLGMLFEPVGSGRLTLANGTETTYSTVGFKAGDAEYGMASLSDLMEGPMAQADARKQQEQARDEARKAANDAQMAADQAEDDDNMALIGSSLRQALMPLATGRRR